MANRKVVKKLAKTKYGTVVLAIALAVSAFLYFYGNKKTEISPTAQAEFHFIDVGQGDASLIVTDEVFVLVDCGPASSGDSLVDYVKKYTDKLDCVVFSHAHEDHMGAAAKLLDSVETDKIIMTQYDSESAFFSRALDVIEKRDIPVTEAIAGQVHTVGDVKLELFAPAKDFEDLNNNSIIMKATVDGASVMYTGDAEIDAEMAVIKDFSRELSANILKVGHHGSSSSTTEEFYRYVNPDIAVISCGKGNSYGHPHRETVELFEKYSEEYYRTDESGTVVIVCREGKLEIKK